MEDKIETVGELIDYLECFDRGTKILDDINPCWWSPRSVDENEPESIIDAMCVATDLQLIDENKETGKLEYSEHEHYQIVERPSEYGGTEYIVRDNDLVGERMIVCINSPNPKLNNILANAVWGKIQRFMEKEPYVTLD
ncbi:MAG: hypothetical protein IJI80_04340 [Methanobrevibacter sp.]|uniref:hypothetical protein n=1 Tax=Methanobrevibacter sp. TaxID=66852 RepID=UPI0025E5D2E1|nr:hypothetical protein [Methanobrevibacter sp.]MBQ6099015.1 hypothetical protein [Methanobrevibacter sp.]MBQ6138887.1 hypothetical protein [Methanobrevibacter sp.]